MWIHVPYAYSAYALDMEDSIALSMEHCEALAQSATLNGKPRVCAVLAKNMERGWVDPAPIWTDLATFDARAWHGSVDIVAAGFPCQPVSVAGRGLGVDDPRWLWPHVERIIAETDAPFVFLENVPGIVGKGLDPVLRSLAALGFNAEWGCLDAGSVGATHLRDRWFCLAYPGCRDARWLQSELLGRCGNPPKLDTPREDVANTNSNGLESQRVRWVQHGERKAHGNDTDGCSGSRETVGDSNVNDGGQGIRSEEAGFSFPPLPGDSEGWAQWDGPQPAVRRDADGAAGRVHRLRMLGNGVVEWQAADALRILIQRATGGVSDECR